MYFAGRLTVVMARTPSSYICQLCGKCFMADWKNPKYCSHVCAAKATIGKVGAEHPQWKGGRRLTHWGYIDAWTGPNTAEREHRILAERALGHPLPDGVVVHHFDENKAHNAPGNLVICQDNAYHKLLHARKRRLDDTGSFDLKRCRVCKVVKAVSAFSGAKLEWDGKRSACKECDNARNLAYYYQARAKGKAWALRHT